MIEIVIGNKAKLTATFRDTGGALVDPDSVEVSVKLPSGTLETPNVTHVSLGVFTARVKCDDVGDWGFRWQSTAVDQEASAGGQFSVVSDGF